MGKLVLALAYAVPLILLISGWLVWSQKRWFRVTVLVLLPLVYSFHFVGLEKFGGWPSDAALPDEFELLSSDVIEPNAQLDLKGQIHIWAKVDGRQEPRAYILPYDRALHEMLFRAKKKLDQGIRQQGSMKGRERSGQGISVGTDRELFLNDVPPRVLPPKM